jgi:hypothetical protein
MANWNHINRKIVEIEEKSDETILKCDCGHINKASQIFHYKIGLDIHCYWCSKKEYDEKLKKGE